uniref:RNase H type-1 domain-containing protein n=1 Tax=Fagus sylvatica TaxID=28930 RepID=A0A2N9ECS2_FAGSY
MHHVSSDPTIPGRPRAINRRYKKAILSPLLRHRSPLGRPQTGAISDQLLCLAGLPSPSSTDCSPLISQATSVGAVCGKRVSAFTAPIRKDCMVRTRSMEVNAQLLPSSSQSPEMAAMEKQVRDLTPTSKSSPGKTRPSIKNSNSMKLKRRSKGTKGRVRREATPSLDKSTNKSNNRSNNKNTTRTPPRTGRRDKGKGDQKPGHPRPQNGLPIHGKGVPDEIMCRAFPTTLKGPARIWFKKLIPGQREGETLRSYLTRFNKETLLVDGADDKVVLTAFISGLQSGDFLFSVYKDPPTSMSEMMYEAQRYMNGEDALQARDTGKKRRNDYADRPNETLESKPKMQRNPGKKREDRSRRGSNERFNHFTPLNAPVDRIFMQIKDDPALRWPGKLLTNPDRRAKDKYCRFHRDHGHNTEDCYDLKRQIEELIKQGKLQRFVERDQREGRPPQARPQRPPVEDRPRPPMGEIHMINGGMAAGGTSRSSRKAYARQIHNVSADIIYLTAFQQMRIGKDQLRPIETPLVGFAGTSVYPLGIISLQIVAGTYPKQATKKVEFLVVDCPSAYNVIIGRPTLNRLRAVTSTYHLLVRFPTEHGIGEMKGDQAMARECYLTSVSADQVPPDFDCRRSGRNFAEPTEKLEEITLTEGNEKRRTRIGTTMPAEIRGSIVQFLRENADVFAWSHEDMPGISTEVMVHKLNVNPSVHPVKQKRRVFAPERNEAVMTEVDKLLTAGFIREVYYPEWLANVVMVKKPNGKWRMCVDFTDLNKACPKDSYPLPRIDQLIQMEEEDQEKTAFITSRGLFCYKSKAKENEDHLTDLKETFQALRTYNMKLNPEKCAFGVSSGKFLGFMVSQRGIEANPDKIKAILEMSPPTTVKEVQSLTGKAAALNSPSKTGEELYLYLAVSSSAVSSALIREEERVQKPVYYTSRALKGAEERYSNMEKLAFALLIASRKLRPYFQAHSIVVLTDYPLRKAMNKPDAAGRLIQWSIEMSEFDIDYRPRTAIKAQALADFIAEFTHPWEEEGEPEQLEIWTVNIDGSSTKEMGGAGIILVSPEKDKFEYAIQLRFRATNNEAEYEALLAGLKLSKKMGVKNLTVKSDSQLVIGQIKGEYEAREETG